MKSPNSSLHRCLSAMCRRASRRSRYSRLRCARGPWPRGHVRLAPRVVGLRRDGLAVQALGQRRPRRRRPARPRPRRRGGRGGRTAARRRARVRLGAVEQHVARARHEKPGANASASTSSSSSACSSADDFFFFFAFDGGLRARDRRLRARSAAAARSHRAAHRGRFSSVARRLGLLPRGRVLAPDARELAAQRALAERVRHDDRAAARDEHELRALRAGRARWRAQRACHVNARAPSAQK